MVPKEGEKLNAMAYKVYQTNEVEGFYWREQIYPLIGLGWSLSHVHNSHGSFPNMKVFMVLGV